MTFDQLQPGDEVFLDANIFIYYYLGSSRQCQLLLDQCRQNILRGHTATFTLAEVVHRLMMIEAVEMQLAMPGKVVKQLREKPQIIPQLSKYAAVISANQSHEHCDCALDADNARNQCRAPHTTQLAHQ